MTQTYFKNVDTHHLSLYKNSEGFTFSSAHLARLVEDCRYHLTEEKVLFGIRASVALSPRGKWLNEIEIKETEVDHLHLNCLIGIWDRVKHKIAVFQGSTVPYVDFILKQKKHPNQKISNQLLQGLYTYYVGAHEPENRAVEEGAFRLTRLMKVPVWRELENEELTLEASIPGNNIHSAGTIHTDFRSAGCQVIAGDHIGIMPSGEYQTFRIYAGQSALPSETEIGLPYQYLLTHSRHLSLIARGSRPELIMMGSTGYEVRQLQEKLITQGLLRDGFINKGYADGQTVEAIWRYQKLNQQLANGIYILK